MVLDLADAIRETTSQTFEMASVDKWYAGQAAEDAAASGGNRLEVVKLPAAKRGFVLLPRR